MAQEPSPEQSQAPNKKEAPGKKPHAEKPAAAPHGPKTETPAANTPKTETPAAKQPATNQAPAMTPATAPATTKADRKSNKKNANAPASSPAASSTSTENSAATSPATSATPDVKQKGPRNNKNAKTPAATASASPSASVSTSPASTPKTSASVSPAAAKTTATPATTPAATAAASTTPATSASPSAAATAAATASPTTSATAASTTTTSAAATKKPDPAKVQQIRQQYTSFTAQPRPDRVPAVTFSAGYRLPGVETWQGPQYEVYRSYRPERHDRGYYSSRYQRVELIAGGYYYFNNGYWYPAWGYDPGHEYYAYDAPIYVGKRSEPPDKVIANVQAVLKDMGYYRGEVDGLIGPLTREALTGYQRDNGMTVTAVIDEPTLDSLNMSS